MFPSYGVNEVPKNKTMASKGIHTQAGQDPRGQTNGATNDLPKTAEP